MTDAHKSSYPDLPAEHLIAICDDDPDDRRRLREETARMAAPRILRFAEFADGASMLSSSEPFDLIFLDIFMKGQDGVEIARQMRKRNSRALIVFVTSSREHLVAGYEVEAFRYLLKPYTAAQLEAVVSKALARLDKRGLVVRCGSSVERIPFEQISYIEAQGRRCIVFMNDGSEFSVGEGISRLEKKINQELLVRCQKSFIVNLGQVASICRYEATLKNGAVVPIGRQLWTVVQDRFISYLSLE